jgi:hypothetical protein
MLLTFCKRRYFSSIDLINEYWQIKMDDTSIELTAFPAVNGHFEWNVKPYGLTNAVATCERFMERVMEVAADGLV